MDLLHAIFLALLQGFTEFLPISSSGHLVLTPHVLGWPDQGLAFDVAVHLGTLCAVVAYFRHELVAILGVRDDLPFRCAESTTHDLNLLRLSGA